MAGRPIIRRAPGSPVRRGLVVMAAVLVAGWFAPSVTHAAASDDAFTISGDVVGVLTPGTQLPLNLTLHNLTGDLLNLKSLQVRLTGVTPPPGAACTTADFALRDAVLGALALPAHVGDLLSGLGLGIAEVPTVTMLDTSANQDGCKGAKLTLDYLGVAENPSGKPSHGHGSNGSGDDVDGAHSGLPGTGAEASTWWLGLLGLTVAAAGATTVTIVRREKRDRS